MPDTYKLLKITSHLCFDPLKTLARFNTPNFDSIPSRYEPKCIQNILITNIDINSEVALSNKWPSFSCMTAKNITHTKWSGFFRSVTSAYF